MKALKIIMWILLGLMAAVVLGLILGLVVQHLWNWLIPPIFGLPVITYWQAVGLFILFHLLFGNHPAHHQGTPARHPGSRFADRVRSRMHRKEDAEDGMGTVASEAS